MKKALIDVAVLLVFFTRHEQFRQVFEQVKKARPSKLFLYQDGPREDHPEDMENINKCRAIADEIDWEVEVHHFYQTKNKGVDPSGYLADRWAFSQTDKCIVLEDDIVPSLSFFAFCKKMLDEYENDNRIMLISGMNVEEETKGIDSDYFFSTMTITWGWASWGRVVNNWDPEYNFLDNKEKRVSVQNYIDENKLVRNTMNIFACDRKSQIEHFESILISNQYLNRGLSIVPKKNMINNIGITEDASHFASNINVIAKGFRKIFTMPRYEIDIENLVAPEDIQDYKPYKNSVYRIYAWRHPLVKMYRCIEVMFYQLKEGNFADAKRDIFHKIKKFITRTST